MTQEAVESSLRAGKVIQAGCMIYWLSDDGDYVYSDCESSCGDCRDVEKVSDFLHRDWNCVGAEIHERAEFFL